MNTSFSALNTFRTCARKYKYQVIDKIKSPKSPEAIFGTLVHSTMKFIHTGDFIYPTTKEALNYFSRNWNPDVFNDEIRERAAFAQGIKIIQNYYNKNDPNKIDIVAVESRFTIELEDTQKNETHLISGFIDRIDKTTDGFEIIDYKTSRKLPPQSSVNDSLQLLIYLLAFLKRYPKEQDFPSIKLSLYFLQHGTKLSATKTAEQIKLGKEDLLETIHEIASSDFSPIVNPLCDWCGYQNICPMWKHKFQDQKPKVQSQKEVNAIVKKYLELNDSMKSDRKLIAELKEKIVEIMKQERVERLFGENKIVAKTQRKTYSFDEEKLKKILKKEGLWEAVLKLNQTQLKKVIQALPLSVKKEIEKTRKLSRESWGLSVKKQ